MEKKIPIRIDGKDVEATAGQTILECARDNGIFIPTLCHYTKTTNVGACRVCVVEVEGARSLAASCCMPVTPNMAVRPATEAVRKDKKMIIEQLWSSGDHNSLNGEQNGNCDLKKMV